MDRGHFVVLNRRHVDLSVPFLTTLAEHSASPIRSAPQDGCKPEPASDASRFPAAQTVPPRRVAFLFLLTITHLFL